METNLAAGLTSDLCCIKGNSALASARHNPLGPHRCSHVAALPPPDMQQAYQPLLPQHPPGGLQLPPRQFSRATGGIRAVDVRFLQL
jgi:hypothetical protein